MIGIGVGIGRNRYATGGTPAALLFLLLESGDFLLQEDNSKILL